MVADDVNTDLKLNQQRMGLGNKCLWEELYFSFNLIIDPILVLVKKK